MKKNPKAKTTNLDANSVTVSYVGLAALVNVPIVALQHSVESLRCSVEASVKDANIRAGISVDSAESLVNRVHSLLENREPIISVSRIAKWDAGVAADMDRAQSPRDKLLLVMRLLSCLTAVATVSKLVTLLDVSHEEWKRSPLPESMIDKRRDLEALNGG